MTSALTDDLSVLAEIVFEAGGHEERIIDVERYQIKYSPSDSFNVAIGRMHTILGYWNQTYHHGTWFQTTAFRPDVYRFEDEDGVLPIHEVGLRVFGARSLRGSASTTARAWPTAAGPSPAEVDNVQDVNGSKAVNLWLAACSRPLPASSSAASFTTIASRLTRRGPARERARAERIFGGFFAYQRRRTRSCPRSFN